METRSTVSVIKNRMQECSYGQRERGRELLNDFLSIDMLQIAELFVEDKFLRDLRVSLNFQPQQRTKCWEF